MWIDQAQSVAQLTCGDQHCYLVVDRAAGVTAAIDPGSPAFLPLIEEAGLQPATVINTHGHHDHDGGNAAVVEAFSAEVRRFGRGDRPLADGEVVAVGHRALRVLHTPGHTDDGICLHLDDRVLFCGDTLFIASCGNSYGEASMRQLFGSLGRIEALDDDTVLCCGHDYADAALGYTLDIEPDNRAAREKRDALAAARRERCPVVSTLAEEYAYNPFFRLHTESMESFLGSRCGEVPEDVWGRFQLLRELKNR